MELYDKATLECARVRTKCGIYCFLHRDSGKRYVGQAVHQGRRLNSHKSEAKNGPKTYFDTCLARFGIGAFDWCFIEECPKDEIVLKQREKYWMDFYDSVRNGFNTVENPASVELGGVVREITRQRMREAKLGKKLSPEHCAKISAMNKGKIMSPETRAKLSVANTGKVRSPEAREKVRKFRLGYTIPESTKSKMRESAKHRPPISEITREKLRKSSTGFHHSEATKQKLRELKTGLVKSPETIEKLRVVGLGRKHSPETLARMRASALARGPSELRNKKLQEAADRRFGKNYLDGNSQGDKVSP